MLNRHKQTLKISFFAILLAMMAWMVIGVGGASGNNQHNPSLDDVQKPATATPRIDSKLNRLGSTQLQSQPTECSLYTSPPQASQNRVLNRALLEARTPPYLIASLLYPVSLSVMGTMGTNVDAIYNNVLYLQSNTSARRSPHLSTCTVTTPADSGPESLRQCLLDTTANGTITFDAQTFPPATPTTISLSSALPAITSDGLTIDGTHAGVVLSGKGLSSEVNGLVVDGADGVTIRGLQIINFLENSGILLFNGASNAVIGGNTPEARNVIGGNKIGIQIAGSGSNNNKIIGNYIGTDATGMNALGNEYGIALRLGAQNNIIGGTLEGERNIISGNQETGVQIQDTGTNSNQVLGNYIGTDVTGNAALGNNYGVGIALGAQNNIIGGETEQTRNIISGNRKTGVQIQGTDTNGNQVLGNYIGTNVNGNAPLGNDAGIGIRPDSKQSIGPSNNVIGGSVEGARNLISGNESAIQILSSNQNRIQGNYIGTDERGMNRLSNDEGIIISDNAQNNIIGGDTEDARNIISGNEKNGIWIGTWRSETRGRQATSGNQVLGNYIGVNAEGTAVLGNKWGVTLNESQNNMIGCDSLEGCNIISGNSEVGIMIQGAASNNQVVGNYIGTNADGTSALANGLVGIGIIEGSHDNIIGGNTEGKRNIISGNIQTGIDIRHAETTNNQVIGNYIGTNKKGDAALPNRWGVAIVLDAHHNIIGGTGSAGNLISGNTEAGVQIQGVVPENDNIQGDSADYNRVQGNYIGTNADGSKAIGNRWGIDILAGAKHNLIGGTEAGEGNLISGNLESGIELLNASYGFITFIAKENQIQGNQIGIGADGSPLGNGFAGICLFRGTNLNTIGPGNTIAHNADAGVRIQDFNTDKNTITQNTIHDNSGLPIDFTGLLIFGPPIDSPTLSNWSSNTVSGTACANCKIEIFANPDSTPAGTQFLVAGNADGEGNFTITLPSQPSCLSATATDQDGTTSEFSNSLCEQSTPTPTTPDSTVTPTASNSPTVTPTATSVTVTPTASNTPTVTPTATSVTVTPTASNSPTVTPTTTPVTVTPPASNSPTATSVTVTPTASNSPTVTTQSNQLYLPLVIR